MNKVLELSRMMFLDSGVLVRLLQMHPDYYPVISAVLDSAYEKNATILVSQITLFELSRKAYAAGEGVLARQYREFFEHSRNVKSCDINSEIAVKAAEILNQSAKNGNVLSTEESLRLATAFVCGADCFLTDQGKFHDLTDVPVVTLDEII